MSGPLVLSAVVSLALVGLLVAAGAGLTRPLWSSTPFLAPAYGLLVLGPVAMLVWGSWLLGPGTGAVTSYVVLMAALVVVVLRVRATPREDLVGLGRAALPIVMVTVCLLVSSVALLTLWRTELDPFALASIRFTHQLPIDGQIPSMITERLVEGGDARTAVPGWLSSDRPPLQAGLLLLAHGVPSFLNSGLVLDLGMGVAAQSVWVLGGWSVARAVGASPRAAVAGLVFVGASGSLLVNTVFTWPKLLSAAFALAAVAIALQHRREGAGRSRLPEITVLVALGLLSHGAAVFALPVVLLCLGRVSGRVLRSIPLALAGGLVVYVPWLAYQRLYDPPGDRLLSWHLAGVIEPTDAGFVQDLTTAYGDLDLPTLVTNKVTNLDYVFAQWPVPVGVDWTLSAFRGAQFFTTSGALALTWVPLLALVGVSVAHAARRRPDPVATRVLGVLGACVVGLVFWALVMFGPGTTFVHQGSHVPIVLAGLLSTAWVAGRSSLAATALVVAQFIGTAVIYGPRNGGAGLDAQVQPTAVALLAVSLLVLIATVVLTPGEPAARPTTPEVQPQAGDTDTRPMQAARGPLPTYGALDDPSAETVVLAGAPVGAGRRSAPPPR